MRATIPFLTLLLLACSPPAQAPNGGEANDDIASQGEPPATPLRPATIAPEAASGEWTLDAAGLQFIDSDQGVPVLSFACHQQTLTVRLPLVTQIGSEERVSIGGGGDVETLVADLTMAGGTIEARGPAPAPARMLALLTAGPGASYGATAVGPLAPVPAAMAKRFVEGCR